MATISEMFVEIGADASQFDQATRAMQQDMRELQRDMQTMSAQITGSSSRMGSGYTRMSAEMKAAVRAQRRALEPFRRQQHEVEYGFFQMAQGMGSYTGSTSQFIAGLTEMGNRQRTINDQMIASNNMVRMGFIQGIAAMLARSTASSKIAANFDRMRNPLYRVNNGLLAVTGGLERMAARGQPAVLALRLLGPTANMKKLNDMTRMITAGLMRMNSVALVAAAGTAILFTGLAKAAMDSVPGYKSAVNQMGAAVRKAFQPMVEVFAAVTKPIIKLITHIANMAIAFNKAHPTLAKIIQGFLMLIPLLTLILSPLAIGIGLWAGLQAAFASVAPFIMPLITGLGAMMGTVLLVSAAIAALTGGIIYLWKHNEGFRKSVENMIAKLKEFAGVIGAALKPVIDRVSAAFANLGNAIQKAITGDFGPLLNIFKSLIPSMISFLVGGIPGLIITAARFLPAISQGITSNTAVITTTINNVVNSIVSFLTNKLPVFLTMGVNMLNKLVQGVVSALPVIVSTFVNIITMLVPVITALLPMILNAGISILQAIIDGILKLLPALLTAILNVIQALVQVIATNLPLILNAGIKILMSLIDGIMKILPNLITTAIKLITSIVDTLVKNLPKIIDSGIKILTKLIEGVTKMLPQLITMAINLITQIVNTLIKNLPKMIDSGIKILTALIKGIGQVLPQLVTAAINLVTQIVKAVIANLPAILSAGKQILTALKDGIIQISGTLLSSLKTSVIDPMIEKVKGVDLSEIGKDIIQGLINGIGSMAGSLAKAVSGVVGGIKDKITGALDIHSPSRWMRDMIGKNITLGMAIGIDSEKGTLMKSLDNVSNGIKNNLTNNLKGVNSIAGLGNNQSKPGNTFNFYPQKAIIDENDITRQFQRMEVLYGG